MAAYFKNTCHLIKSSSLQGQKIFLWRSILKKAGISHCSQQCFSLYPESQYVWERSEAKKTSQISLYFSCKILERGCLDPPSARQEPRDVHICIMGCFFHFSREVLQSWMRTTTLLLPVSQAVSQFRDSPSVFPEVFRGHGAELLWS